MGKKIIFLEDKPEKLTQVIADMQLIDGIDAIEVLYYNSKKPQNPEKVSELAKILHVEVKAVNFMSFENVLDELYEQPDNLFIFDTVLNEEEYHWETFTYRNNISYALRKKEQNGDENQRIWFYTTVGYDIKERIDDLFGTYVMQAQAEDNNKFKLYFDANTKFSEAIQMG